MNRDTKNKREVIRYMKFPDKREISIRSLKHLSEYLKTILNQELNEKDMVKAKKVSKMKCNHSCLGREHCLYNQNDVKINILRAKNL